MDYKEVSKHLPVVKDMNGVVPKVLLTFFGSLYKEVTKTNPFSEQDVKIQLTTTSQK